MGLFTKDIATLDDLYVHQLQDVYYAENQITKALPKMIEKATSQQLKASFQTHLMETENQIERLKRVFEMHGEKPKAVTCAAMGSSVVKKPVATTSTSISRRVPSAVTIALPSTRAIGSVTTSVVSAASAG